VKRAVAVVGIGADGCAGLSSRAVGAVARARVLAGGRRHLEFFPQFRGERIAFEQGLSVAVERIVALADEESVCVLASGDPLFFGVGSLLLRRIRAVDLEFIPHPSSVQWAFSRAGLPWEDAAFLSLHGRGLEGLAARLRRRRKAALLTDGEHAPRALARHLIEHGERLLTAVLCEDLCGVAERVRSFTLEELAMVEEVHPLCVLLLLRQEPWTPPPAIPFLSDQAFERRRGLITKRELRLLALGELGLREDCVAWDIGAGSGAVAVEAALVASEGRVYAIEADPECVELCRRNARAHGADNLRVVAGFAPEVLCRLEAPDAVFIGGSGGRFPAILDVAVACLRPGGRLVASAATLETLDEARRGLAQRGLSAEITLATLARSAPIGGRTRLVPLSPVHLVAAQKTGRGAA